MRLLLLGPPGSGKGTQAELLSDSLGVPAISTGDMLREAVAAGTELGSKVESVMTAGELVDDGLMAEVVSERLAQEDASDGFLLDGYPRTSSQAETLDRILAERDQSLDHALLIEVPEDVLVRRAVARQRADDREDVVRERLRVYREKTEPLIALYRDRGLLRVVDGDRSIDDVHQAVKATIR
jgi:adenylate kinase